MIKNTVYGGTLAAMVALAPMVFTAGTAQAQTSQAYRDATAPLIVGLLQSRGLPAAISYSKSTGNPYVRSRVDGFNFAIFFFSCTKDTPRRCKGVQFYSGYKKVSPLTLALMNDWNRRKRYARGYLVADNNTGQLTRARIEMDLSFSGGMTRSIFMANLRLFQRLKKSFRTHIGFRSSGPVRRRSDGQGIESLQD